MGGDSGNLRCDEGEKFLVHFLEAGVMVFVLYGY